jgi:hypothetical protein
MTDLEAERELSALDRDALERAMAAARAESAGRSQQLDELLQQESWVEVASFAATIAQTRALDLMPWETAPVDAETLCWEHGRQVVKRDPKAGALLDRMLAAGLSRFEPSPIEALKAAKALRAAKVRA